MLKLRFLIFVLFVTAHLSGLSQSKADSLRNIIGQGKSDSSTVQAYIDLCEHHYKTGDYNKVMEYSLEAKKMASAIGYNSGIMKALFQRIKVLKSQGESDQAMKLCMEGLGIAEKSKDVRMETVYSFQMGQIFENQKNFNNALVYYQKAFEKGKKENYRDLVDASISNIGNIYSESGDHAKALNCYFQSLTFAMQEKDTVSMADSYLNIGNEYFFQGNSNEAMKWYYKAAKIYESNGIKNQLALCYINIASMLDENKEYRKALELYEKGIAILKELKQRSYLAEGYLSMANVYSRMGNYQKAFSNMQLSKNYYDSVYNEDMIAQTSELQTKYETDKKEKENQILKQQNDLQSLSINRQRIITYSVSLGLFLMLVLAFYIYRGFKQKQKANMLLERKQKEITVKNNELELANRIIHEKNKDITDSIRYAKRLQSAILKPEGNISELFEDGFIFFRPKDIVSGDFYWFEKFGNLSLVAAADCTGHGVPGAFMSIIGCNLLSQTVNEYAMTKPAAILNSVNKGLSKVLQQRNEQVAVNDGMDVALCVFNADKMSIEYAGAYNPLWLVREGKLTEYKADKFPVGAFVDNQIRMFRSHEIPVEKGDMIYLFSDGYADQFGGPHGKKFKYKALQRLMTEHFQKPGHIQRDLFEQEFERWMGSLDQVDDVLLIGVRI
jgi:serine phosphatase RsbU (regulator of sigma subunit)